MKIVILGAGGMVGHVLARYLKQDHTIITVGSSNSTSEDYNLDLTTHEGLTLVMGILIEARPDLVINCIGLLVKASNDDPTKAEQINSSLPHQLAYLCSATTCKLIHISTDCVFDGSCGGHHETDVPTETSMYGSSKAKGEIKYHPVHLTIRTSIIGPELKSTGTGLLHWFLNQTGEVGGYSNAFWNGVTTLELAKYIQHTIEHPRSGMVHLTSAEDRISKKDMLLAFQSIFDNNVTKVNEIVLASPIDKTLVDTQITGYGRKPFIQQLEELKHWYY